MTVLDVSDVQFILPPVLNIRTDGHVYGAFNLAYGIGSAGELLYNFKGHNTTDCHSSGTGSCRAGETTQSQQFPVYINLLSTSRFTTVLARAGHS